jgi:L-glyceraldehyde 3-phosphate reductase
VRLLIHQPSYSMVNRWIEEELLDVLGREGIGCIAFSPLAQGLLTDKYLAGGSPNASRARFFKDAFVSEENLEHVRALDAIASERGQSLAQMAIAWTLRDPRVTSTLVGASSVSQLEENVAALDNLDFTPDELAAIDEHAVDSGVDAWRVSSEA